MPKVTTVPSDPQEKEILKIFRPNRGPNSYFAGSAVIVDILNRRPYDYDIYHPTPSTLALAFSRDRQAIKEAGARCTVDEQPNGDIKAQVELSNCQVNVEWELYSGLHIFGPLPDRRWGYRHHSFDIAVYKMLKAAKHGAAKDLIDLLTIHSRLVSFAALVWAAPSQDARVDPQQVITALTEWWSAASRQSADVKALVPRARKMLAEAMDTCRDLPAEKRGCVFLPSPAMPVVPSNDAAKCLAFKPVSAGIVSAR